VIDVTLDVGKHAVRIRKPIDDLGGHAVVEVSEQDLLKLVTNLQKCVNKAHELGWDLHGDAVAAAISANEPIGGPARSKRGSGRGRSTK